MVVLISMTTPTPVAVPVAPDTNPRAQSCVLESKGVCVGVTAVRRRVRRTLAHRFTRARTLRDLQKIRKLDVLVDTTNTSRR